MKHGKKMTAEAGVEYLNNIINNWNSFCRGHRKATEAIKEIIAENSVLKRENAILKAQLKDIKKIIS